MSEATVAKPQRKHPRALRKKSLMATTLGSIGVVYGDIGTSPLYALRAALVHFASDGLERWEILGVLSLIVWSVIIVVTVKYVLIVLRADNRGEGGILALMALAQRAVGTERGRHMVALIGIAGKNTAIGDAIGLAVKRLRQRPADSRVLVLITDGANNGGEIEPKVVADAIVKFGIDTDKPNPLDC